MLGNLNRQHAPDFSEARRTIQIFQASRVGCPIRRSMDQSSFAAPHGFSQRITSFIACACQGIHQMPLRHLIVLIANAHPYWIWTSCPLRLRSRGGPNLTIPATLRLPRHQFQSPVTFYNRTSRMPSTCSIRAPHQDVTPSDIKGPDLKTSFSR
jgi:hypothetical protein